MKITILLIVLLLSSCASYDLDFTWQNECDYYHRCDVPMPKIIVSDESPVNADGDRILGRYMKDLHIVMLYKGYDADTIEHEFAHALGDDLGEK